MVQASWMPTKWKDFVWPSWVPREVRDEIESFWGPGNHRTPREWYEMTVMGSYNNQPPLGAEVIIKTIDGEEIRGLWVPAWNNMGRVVLEGDIHVIANTIEIKLLKMSR